MSPSDKKNHRRQGQEGNDGVGQGQEGSFEHRPAGYQEVWQEINDRITVPGRLHLHHVRPAPFQGLFLPLHDLNEPCTRAIGESGWHSSTLAINTISRISDVLLHKYKPTNSKFTICKFETKIIVVSHRISPKRGLLDLKWLDY